MRSRRRQSSLQSKQRPKLIRYATYHHTIQRIWKVHAMTHDNTYDTYDPCHLSTIVGACTECHRLRFPGRRKPVRDNYELVAKTKTQKSVVRYAKTYSLTTHVTYLKNLFNFTSDQRQQLVSLLCAHSHLLSVLSLRK